MSRKEFLKKRRSNQLVMEKVSSEDEETGCIRFHLLKSGKHQTLRAHLEVQLMTHSTLYESESGSLYGYTSSEESNLSNNFI